MEKAQHTTETESIQSANEFSKENFENPKPFLIQTKLSVGAVDDPFEREADTMADRIMRMPETSFIQRKCASCEEEEKIHRMPETTFLQRKCDACEHEEEKIHRKITPFIQKQSIGSEGGQVSNSVSNQIENSRGGGNRMSENTLSFMESRFGADFSGVKIHTDSNAVQMSRELNAQAFTVGSDIYFNAGKYAPESNSGKHLLAHELTHTVQQGGGIERKVQRRVSPRINQLRDHLSYGIFDWAITDGDVASVLLTLRELNPQDLQDTVLVLEREGLIGRLYENLQESDDRTLDMIPEFMQRVQAARYRRAVRGSTTQTPSSCNNSQYTQTQTALSHVNTWVNRCIDAIITYSIGIDNVEVQRIGRLLDKYFFHEAQTGVLTQAQRDNYGSEMITRLNNVREGASNTIIDCVSPFDLTCRSAGAYVSGGTPPIMRMCNSFFGRELNYQIATTFHELMHFYNRSPRVGDTGYNSERVFEYMPPDRSINNADSYSTFATELMLGARVASQELRTTRDTVEGCNPAQEANLRREIAYATRMIQNAVNQIDDDYAGQDSGGAASTNFHSTNHQDLIRFVNRFHTVQDAVPRQIEFHCDTTSTQVTDTLPFVEGDGLRLTQPYFNIATENQRIDTLLAILFKKHSDGMTAPVWSSAPSFATQTIDQAYTNPGAFVGYIRAMLQVREIWNFADAEVRYREELARTIEGIEGDFNESFFDNIFRSMVSNRIISELTTSFNTTPISNRNELQTRTQSVQSRVATIRLFLNRMHHDFYERHQDNFMTGLLAFSGSTFSESQLYRNFDVLHRRILGRLYTSFTPILVRINNGETVRMEDWADYDTILSDYRTESQQMLSVMRTYIPYVQQIHNIQESYQHSRNTLQDSPQVQNLDFDTFIDTIDNFSTNRTDFLDEIEIININVRKAIREGRNFSNRDPDLPNLAQLLSRYQSQLRNLVPPNRP